MNKNLWSTSFGLVTGGLGLVGLAATYVLVDVLKLWTGAIPYHAMPYYTIASTRVRSAEWGD